MRKDEDDMEERGEQMMNDTGAAVVDRVSNTDTLRIRALNDRLRRFGQGGLVMLTASLRALPEPDIVAILEAVQRFDRFSPDNDPYGEHDCAVLNVAGHEVIWKIDSYDTDISFGSPDPADPAVTTRVLTIMLAQDY